MYVQYRQGQQTKWVCDFWEVKMGLDNVSYMKDRGLHGGDRGELSGFGWAELSGSHPST